MSDDDANYVIRRRLQSSDIETGEKEQVRVEAPNKEDVKELFDYARNS